MADLTATAGLPLLSDYPRFVRRHRTLLALITGTGLLFGIAWAAAQPSTFSATASVVLVPVPVYVTPATQGLLPPEVSIDTDAQLLRGPRVLAAIGDAIGTDARAALDHLSVTASPNSHVLHVTVTAASAEVAARAADAAVASFIDVRREALGSLARDQLRQLRLFVIEQEDLLAREQSRRLVITGNDELLAQTLELRAGLRELQQARREPARVVRPAVPATFADHANAQVPITSGAALGLLTGWLLGWRRDRARQPAHRSTTTRTEDDHHGQ